MKIVLEFFLNSLLTNNLRTPINKPFFFFIYVYVSALRIEKKNFKMELNLYVKDKIYCFSQKKRTKYIVLSKKYVCSLNL